MEQQTIELLNDKINKLEIENNILKQQMLTHQVIDYNYITKFSTDYIAYEKHICSQYLCKLYKNVLHNTSNKNKNVYNNLITLYQCNEFTVKIDNKETLYIRYINYTYEYINIHKNGEIKKWTTLYNIYINIDKDNVVTKYLNDKLKIKIDKNNDIRKILDKKHFIEIYNNSEIRKTVNDVNYIVIEPDNTITKWLKTISNGLHDSIVIYKNNKIHKLILFQLLRVYPGVVIL